MPRGPSACGLGSVAGPRGDVVGHVAATLASSALSELCPGEMVCIPSVEDEATRDRMLGDTLLREMAQELGAWWRPREKRARCTAPSAEAAAGRLSRLFGAWSEAAAGLCEPGIEDLPHMPQLQDGRAGAMTEVRVAMGGEDFVCAWTPNTWHGRAAAAVFRPDGSLVYALVACTSQEQHVQGGGIPANQDQASAD